MIRRAASVDRWVPALPFAVLLAAGFGPVRGTAAPAAPDAPAAPETTGITIAVIGSGIDYTHGALGGVGDADLYAANDPTAVEPGSFPAGDVVGGYDFAGELYSSACPDPVPADNECSPLPMPDGDPLDRAGGLGTSVAGVALEAAPGAHLVALKIFGQPTGVAADSALHAQALEWVLAHNRGQAVPGTAPAGRIDVVLDSGGGGAWSGGRRALDELVGALAEDGVTVVAPAGENGGTPFVVGGVGATDAALSVAAVVARGEQAWGIRAEWAGEVGLPTVREHEARDARPPMATVAGSERIVAPLAWYGLACTGDDGSVPPPAQEVDERIALIERGDCTFVDKVRNAEASGAIAALLFTDHRSKTNPQGGGADAPRIPSVMIDRDPGLELRELVLAGTEVSVTLDADYEFRKAWLDGTLLEGTSRGPEQGGRTGPSLAADGAGVRSPVAGSGDALAARSGTALAGAAVAGAAAMLHQRLAELPATRPGDVAALLAATADPSVFFGRNDTGPRAPVALQGAGVLDLDAALDGTLVARVAGSRTDLGFVAVRADAASESWAPPVELTSSGSEDRTLRVEFELAFPEEDADSGVRVLPPSDPVVVGAGETVPISVAIRIDPGSMPAWTLGDGNPIDDPGAFGALEVDGWLTVREAEPAGDVPGDALGRIPAVFLARPSSRIEAEPIETAADPPSSSALAAAVPGTSATIAWTNSGAAPGRLVPAVSVGSDPSESDGLSDGESDGSGRGWGPTAHRASTAADPIPGALDMIGIAVRTGPDPRAPEDETPEALIEWRITTRATRVTPAAAAFDVLLDLDLDGEVDRIVTSVRGPEARRGLADTTWYAAVTYPRPGTLEPDFSRLLPSPIPIEWDIGDATMVMRARAVDLVLDVDASDERFRFGVRSRDPRAFALAPDGGRTAPGAVADLAPDNLEAGAMYGFDQRVHGCYRFGFEGSGAGVLSGLGADGEVVLAPGESAAIEVTTLCVLDHGLASPPDVAFFTPDNGDLAWERSGIGSRVLLWPVGRDGPKIHLPYAVSAASVLP